MNGFGNALIIFCAGKTRDQYVDADGQADEHADDHIVERADRADGGERLITGKAPDDDGIRRVKEQLEDTGKHDRQGEEEDFRQKRAFGHIHGAVGMGFEHKYLLYAFNQKEKNMTHPL